jgi:hypothetical protein
MHDSLLLDALDELNPLQRARVQQRWPRGWPTPDSGELSVRQLHWLRWHVVLGHPFDPTHWLMEDPR